MFLGDANFRFNLVNSMRICGSEYISVVEVGLKWKWKRSPLVFAEILGRVLQIYARNSGMLRGLPKSSNMIFVLFL